MTNTARSAFDLSHLFRSVVRWFDSEYQTDQLQESSDKAQKTDWARIVPFVILHLMCFAVIWVGWSWTAVLTAVGLYVIRMFAITGFYHRYFSHKTFKTNRFWQYLINCFISY